MKTYRDPPPPHRDLVDRGGIAVVVLLVTIAIAMIWWLWLGADPSRWP